MEYLAPFGLAAAFRLGPWCWTAYPAAVLHWDTLWPSLMLECSQSKVLAVKASQLLSVGKSAVARGWPLFALVSASAGLVAEIITDRQGQIPRSLPGLGFADHARASDFVRWGVAQTIHHSIEPLLFGGSGQALVRCWHLSV